MIDHTQVQQIVEDTISQQGAFLVDLNIDSGNHIKVVADHIERVSLDQLVQLSRAIEGAFDRDDEDFEIMVTSPGVGEPLKVWQQYVQNVGRTLKVETKADLEFKGQLTSFENDVITLEWKEREPKKVGKGKITVNKEIKIPIADIKRSRVQIEFK